MVHRQTDVWRRLLPVALSTAAVSCVALLAPVAHTIERPASGLAALTMATDERSMRSSIADVLAPASASRTALFFGYVEFDADPDAPGGVPGFGPWPTAPTAVTRSIR